MTKLALSQLLPQTSFLNIFHSRMGANMHNGPVHPHQTKVCIIIGDLTNPCFLDNSSRGSMGKKNILEENRAALQGTGKQVKPNQDQTHLILQEGSGFADHIISFYNFSL